MAGLMVRLRSPQEPGPPREPENLRTARGFSPLLVQGESGELQGSLGTRDDSGHAAEAGTVRRSTAPENPSPKSQQPLFARQPCVSPSSCVCLSGALHFSFAALPACSRVARRSSFLCSG